MLDEIDEATTDYAEAGLSANLSMDLTRLFYPWGLTTPSNRFKVMSWFEWSQQEFKRLSLLLPTPSIVAVQSKKAGTSGKAATHETSSGGFGAIHQPPKAVAPKSFGDILPPPPPVVPTGFALIQPPPAPVAPK